MIKKQLIDLLQLTPEQLSQPVILAQHPKNEAIFFLILNQKANAFNDEFIRNIHFALDKVVAHEGHTALITTSFHPTIFSGGLDLNVVGVCLAAYSRKSTTILEQTSCFPSFDCSEG